MDIPGIFAAVESHALSSGYFERVNMHEPKNAPGKGLTASVWVDAIRPIRTSGLTATSAVLLVNIRCQVSMTRQPQDSIDQDLLTAVSDLMGRFCSNFKLDADLLASEEDDTRNVDVLGSESSGLNARAGYLDQDNTKYRVMVISLPIIANDVWALSPGGED